MPEPLPLSPLPAWETFYVIVGSAAAALTGLQFVVIALVAESRRQSSGGEIGAFGTPTIVHFGAVLWVAAVLSAPWRGLAGASIVLAITGAAGAGYAGLTFLRARRQTGYVPVLEDGIWHTALPFVAYSLVLGAGLGMVRHATGALFGVGGAAVLLLFIGIHNAWDTVTFVALGRLEAAASEPARSAPRPTEPPAE